MSLQFNSNGKLAKFYHFFQKDEEALPEDFCTYFWGLVIRALFMLAIPGQIIGRGIYGLFLLIKFTWAHKMGALYWIIAAIGVMLLTLLAIWLNKRRKRLRFEFLDEVKVVVTAKIDAVKNRYCPRIEWREP
jgi:hypothetical protein